MEPSLEFITAWNKSSKKYRKWIIWAFTIERGMQLQNTHSQAKMSGLSRSIHNCCHIELEFVLIVCIQNRVNEANNRYIYYTSQLKSSSTIIIIYVASRGWVGLWGFLWWAPSAQRKDHHGVSSGWSSVWHRSNAGLFSTQYEQIQIILGVWPFWLTPFFFRSITFWRVYG